VILQRAIEAAGIPTVLVAALPTIAAQLGSPRVAAPDTPMGATMGGPDDPAQQSRILRASLRLLETAEAPGQIVHLAETYRTES
jgi:D-proline reductase (dithiol) PrdA